ncbi:MAG TPA: SulP family inorganic anion transporter, partial [Burkholderiaceae bacterium]
MLACARHSAHPVDASRLPSRVEADGPAKPAPWLPLGLNRFVQGSVLNHRYSRSLFQHDLGAALVVTALLIQQSVAFALLAGLPPQVGIYASMLPLLG